MSPKRRYLALHASDQFTPRWKFQQTLMMDANFRLKMKDRGATDVSLGPGWAYCVEPSKFKTHVENFGGVEEVCRTELCFTSQI